ncbi:MAG: hypothetical protein WC829_10820 [Hyphomicrobium sp.]|jgi:hypothetical protein
MLDPELQQRFMRHCTEAAFGYSNASTAAYAAFSEQVVNFWTAVLQPTPPKREPELWRWPVPLSPPAPAPQPSALANPFFNPFAWAIPQPPAPKPPAPKPATFPVTPWDAMAQFAEAMSGALTKMSATPVKTVATPANPMTAWLTMFPFAAPTQAWPMAFMMMSSGVPHAIAWPTAEANVAVLDAADVARRSIKQAFASYQSEGGHATSANAWPHMDMLTLMTAVPLNVGTMLAAMRLH